MIALLKKNKSNISALIDQAIVSGSNFLLSIVLVNVLGLNSYGLYVLIWMPILFLVSLQQAIIIKPLYSLFEKQENKSNYLKDMFSIQIILSLLSSILMFFGLHLFGKNLISGLTNELIIGVSVLSPIFLFYEFIRRVFYLKLNISKVLQIDLIAYVGAIISIIVLNEFFNITIERVIYISSTFFFISIILAVKIITIGIVPQSTFSTWKQNYPFSKYLIYTSFLQWFTGNFFLVTGGIILGNVALGSIRIAQGLVGVLHVIFIVIENIAPVKASKILINKNERLMRQYLKSLFFKSLIPVLLLLISLIIFRVEIIDLLYKEAQELTQKSIVLFSMLYLLIFINTMLRIAIRTLERTKIIFISYIITSGISLVLAKPLINTMGANGLFAGMFLIQIVSILIFLFTLKPSRV
ncbi:MAG: hypothetical protein MK105_07600 [Crocinitomicaceae bacterium]|nr:hypothetical protein [Crocinitomicaceae bacterium]